jgi:hypothetical protein
MFDSLDETIRADDHKAVSARERAIKWVIGAIIAVAVFGGLYLSVHLLEG